VKIVIVATTLLLARFFYSPEPRAFYLEGRAQGTTWHITYYAADSVISKFSVDSILQKIDSSLSIYKPYSLIVAFNNSRRGIIVDDHFKKVVKKSMDVWKATGGLSDITVAPLVDAWGFGVNADDMVAPSDSLLGAIRECVSTKLLFLKNDSLIKMKSCVKIDVNGIAQGYTVDVIAAFFQKNHIHNYIIEVGGELRVNGRKSDGEKFRVGIEAPSGDDYSMPPLQRRISVVGGAITTSGNYRKFHESGGKRVSHIIDPRTGRPVENELISVTVYARDAITADGYDNAIMLMGLEKGMKFIERRKNMAAFFIYRRGDGSIADTATAAFQKLFVQ
jgi:thiamine biosynthesis lipoprotein